MTMPPDTPPPPFPMELPPLSHMDDSRRLAESLARLHHVMGILVTYGEFFIPGEALDEVRRAWWDADKSFQRFVRQVLAGKVDLESGQLAGAPGRMKRAFLDREHDGFMSHWNSFGRKRVRLAHARRRAANLTEAGATVLGSIPGGGAFAELFSLVGKHVLHRFERGY